MKRAILRLLTALALATAFLLPFFPAATCQAEIAEGRAAIVNGNTEQARQAAREDAMRTFVERKVGVHIKSETESSMGVLVQDRIYAKSEGYVQIKSVVREGAQGDVYVVVMDLEANEAKIETALEDVKARLQVIQDYDTSRSGVQVAVTGRNEYGQPKPAQEMQNYVQVKLEEAGFAVYANDAVREYMDSQTDLSTPRVSAEVRRIARNNYEFANALLRGTLSTTEVTATDGYIKATVRASFEMIGLDSSEVNSFDDYFTAVDKDRNTAIRKAEDIAVEKAMSVLGQKSLLTVQGEMRGGVHNIKTTVVVMGIRDRNAQGQRLLQGLQAAGCQVIRSSYTSRGELKVSVKAVASSLVELQEKILARVSGLQLGNTDEAAAGTTKLYFMF